MTPFLSAGLGSPERTYGRIVTAPLLLHVSCVNGSTLVLRGLSGVRQQPVTPA